MIRGMENPSEVWRPWPGRDRTHEVSSAGRVRSWQQRGRGWKNRLREPVLLKFFRDIQGYLSVSNGKSRTKVHRIVLEAFVGPCPTGCVTGHLNGNPADNRVENLAWVTPKENVRHEVLHGTFAYGERRGTAKLTEAQVREMRVLHAAGVTANSLAKRFGVHSKTTQLAINGTNWRCVK